VQLSVALFTASYYTGWFVCTAHQRTTTARRVEEHTTQSPAPSQLELAAAHGGTWSLLSHTSAPLTDPCGCLVDVEPATLPMPLWTLTLVVVALVLNQPAFTLDTDPSGCLRCHAGTRCGRKHHLRPTLV
jgi:hypothetical protein